MRCTPLLLLLCINYPQQPMPARDLTLSVCSYLWGGSNHNSKIKTKKNRESPSVGWAANCNQGDRSLVRSDIKKAKEWELHFISLDLSAAAAAVVVQCHQCVRDGRNEGYNCGERRLKFSTAHSRLEEWAMFFLLWWRMALAACSCVYACVRACVRVQFVCWMLRQLNTWSGGR